MPDNFMGHTPVTHKLDRDVKVFQDGLMATLDDARHKLGGAGVGDFVLRLVADPPAQLNVLEDGLAIQWGEDFGIGIDDFHVSRSSLSAIPPLVADGADVGVKYKGLSADGAVFAKLKDFKALCILRRGPFSTKSYGGDIHALKRNMLRHTVVADLNKRGLALAPGKNQTCIVLVPGVRDFVDGHVLSPFQIELPTAHGGRVKY